MAGEILIGMDDAPLGGETEARFAAVDALASKLGDLILGESEATSQSFDVAMNALVAVVSAITISYVGLAPEAVAEVTNEFINALRADNAGRLNFLAVQDTL